MTPEISPIFCTGRQNVYPRLLDGYAMEMDFLVPEGSKVCGEGG